MAVPYPFTTESKIVSIVGRLGVDLRLDDADDTAADMSDVIDEATGEIYFYLQRYALSDIASNNWAQWHATWFAVRALCQRRLNDVPTSVEAEWERREKQLQMVMEGKVAGPGLQASRRPIAVNGYTMDQRRFNNQVRVDRSKTTGVAKNFIVPVDVKAPDER